MAAASISTFQAGRPFSRVGGGPDGKFFPQHSSDLEQLVLGINTTFGSDVLRNKFSALKIPEGGLPSLESAMPISGISNLEDKDYQRIRLEAYSSLELTSATGYRGILLGRNPENGKELRVYYLSGYSRNQRKSPTLKKQDVDRILEQYALKEFLVNGLKENYFSTIGGDLKAAPYSEKREEMVFNPNSAERKYGERDVPPSTSLLTEKDHSTSIQQSTPPLAPTVISFSESNVGQNGDIDGNPQRISEGQSTTPFSTSLPTSPPIYLSTSSSISLPTTLSMPAYTLPSIIHSAASPQEFVQPTEMTEGDAQVEYNTHPARSRLSLFQKVGGFLSFFGVAFTALMQPLNAYKIDTNAEMDAARQFFGSRAAASASSDPGTSPSDSRPIKLSYDIQEQQITPTLAFSRSSRSKSKAGYPLDGGAGNVDGDASSSRGFPLSADTGAMPPIIAGNTHHSPENANYSLGQKLLDVSSQQDGGEGNSLGERLLEQSGEPHVGNSGSLADRLLDTRGDAGQQQSGALAEKLLSNHQSDSGGGSLGERLLAAGSNTVSDGSLGDRLLRVSDESEKGQPVKPTDHVSQKNWRAKQRGHGAQDKHYGVQDKRYGVQDPPDENYGTKDTSQGTKGRSYAANAGKSALHKFGKAVANALKVPAYVLKGGVDALRYIPQHAKENPLTAPFKAAGEASDGVSTGIRSALEAGGYAGTIPLSAVPSLDGKVEESISYHSETIAAGTVVGDVGRSRTRALAGVVWPLKQEDGTRGYHPIKSIKDFFRRPSGYTRPQNVESLAAYGGSIWGIAEGAGAGGDEAAASKPVQRVFGPGR
ncbi:hypothetical protein HYU13_01640 [Candidatus Woesearchaeota archaeon]|nr:hypothetical protein [Candidatus Woesearchaeota archaeon]